MYLTHTHADQPGGVRTISHLLRVRVPVNMTPDDLSPRVHPRIFLTRLKAMRLSIYAPPTSRVTYIALDAFWGAVGSFS